jgi:hypothetical protein
MKEMGRSNPACEMMEQALSQNSTSSNKKILPTRRSYQDFPFTKWCKVSVLAIGPKVHGIKPR